MIHFDMPLQFITGGKSYPGQMAIQRGPQVLAVDKSLNAASVYDRMSDAEGTIRINTDSLVNASSLLPGGWIGRQAYAARLANAKEKMILVPFADASQTEGEIRVWLPLKPKN